MAATDKKKASGLVDQLFDAAFNNARDPRSAEYKAGVRAVLNYRVAGTRIRSAHPMGTAQADAFYAGVDEGHRIWRAHLEAEAQSGMPNSDEPSGVR
jgi:hypothetical protein